MLINQVRVLLIIVTFLFFITGCSQDSPRKASAAANVVVIDKYFSLPGLNRERKIRVYLPPEYQSSQDRYPVLYMHDGQNLFDDATSFVGEWGVDESLNQLYKKNNFSLIVVGIDNGQEKRMNELSPWKHPDFGIAEGEAYMSFVVNVIKPYVDKNYRTLADVNNTAIMGSSMGGLISHYAIFQYPQVFSKAGIFSPSYWFSKTVYPFSQISKLSPDSRLYLLMGAKEGVDMVDNFNKMTAQLKSSGLDEERLLFSVVAEGEHNEAFWRTEFPKAVTWLFR